PTSISALSLHDALPISWMRGMEGGPGSHLPLGEVAASLADVFQQSLPPGSHVAMSWLEDGARDAAATPGAPAELPGFASQLLEGGLDAAEVESRTGGVALRW